MTDLEQPRRVAIPFDAIPVRRAMAFGENVSGDPDVYTDGLSLLLMRYVVRYRKWLWNRDLGEGRYHTIDAGHIKAIWPTGEHYRYKYLDTAMWSKEPPFSWPYGWAAVYRSVRSTRITTVPALQIRAIGALCGPVELWAQKNPYEPCDLYQGDTRIGLLAPMRPATTQVIKGACPIYGSIEEAFGDEEGETVP